MLRTKNPALSDSSFAERATGDTMTLSGTVNKTVALLALVVIGAAFTWVRFTELGPAAVTPWMLGGVLGGLVCAIVLIFKKTLAPVLAPAYAVLEGLALGGISAMFEMRYPGIVMQAVGLTFATAGALLLAYKSGWIRATENFKLGIVAATGGIFLVYMVSLIGGFFGWQIPLIHEAGPVGILFSLVVCAIAALNLVLDFDFIESACGRAPRYMEWYGAFGLLVTLVWLYLEMLRLLSKLRSR